MPASFGFGDVLGERLLLQARIVSLGVVVIVFLAKFLPETRGRTLEQLEEHFQQAYAKH